MYIFQWLQFHKYIIFMLHKIIQTNKIASSYFTFTIVPKDKLKKKGVILCTLNKICFPSRISVHFPVLILSLDSHATIRIIHTQNVYSCRTQNNDIHVQSFAEFRIPQKYFKTDVYEKQKEMHINGVWMLDKNNTQRKFITQIFIQNLIKAMFLLYMYTVNTLQQNAWSFDWFYRNWLHNRIWTSFRP